MQCQGFLLVGSVLLVSPLHSCQRALHIRTFVGNTDHEQFGRTVAAAGDVDGDGCDDLLIGSPYEDSRAFNSGSARVYSGRTGALLYEFEGTKSQDHFGDALAGGRDTDGDRVPDFMIAADAADPHGFNSGSVFLYSGATGALLLRLDGDSTDDLFGHALDFIGDVDRDGRDDLLITSLFDDSNGTDSGTAFVYSGRTGALLRTHTGRGPNAGFGEACCRIESERGQPAFDYAISAPSDLGSGANTGSVYVFDGFTGTARFQLVADALTVAFGLALSQAGDVDGDQTGDLLIGSAFDRHAFSAAGSVHVVSGSDGTTLLTLFGPASHAEFGAAVAPLADVDRDGHDDFLVGLPGLNKARLLSGANGGTLLELEGTNDFSDFGVALARIGHMDVNPAVDFAIGAPHANDFPRLIQPGKVFTFNSLPARL